MKKLSWGHGVVIALGSFIVFILYLILVFPIGKQNAEMISDNYYEEELVYQDVIDAKKNAQHLEIKPIYSQDKNGIKLHFPSERKIDNKQIDIVLFRTDDSNLDIHKLERLDGTNSMLIPAKVLVPGSYTLKTKWKENNQSYQIDYDVLWK
ncbi:nitrogen fixation protein FixH [Chryseobacterium sp. POL2]|nr:nitrogen fixation protein FixH [Chryseobacterium sp. POL2]